MERGAAAHTALRHGRVLFYLTPGAAPAGSAAVEGGAEGPYPPTPPCRGAREGERARGAAAGAVPVGGQHHTPTLLTTISLIRNRVNEFVL